uniref:LAGLIDADG endonuclease n=1 Tax=Sclerotinia borealis TaxID=77105 RepID=A0A088CQW3_9HELO|nr:LAGLIDADG endonuclease [Sclerotinia borealis]AIJ56809.1 LAGLIDADG endonuclease [Sclerotinia borealis]
MISWICGRSIKKKKKEYNIFLFIYSSSDDFFFLFLSGCFSVTIFKSKTSKYGEAVKLRFILIQNVRDENLMKSLIEYLRCGYTTLENRGTVDFKVTKISNIRDVIFPFFYKYPLQGVKSKGFADFSIAVDLVSNKAHLSKEGLDQIRIIQNRMNTNRIV